MHNNDLKLPYVTLTLRLLLRLINRLIILWSIVLQAMPAISTFPIYLKRGNNSEIWFTLSSYCLLCLIMRLGPITAAKYNLAVVVSHNQIVNHNRRENNINYFRISAYNLPLKAFNSFKVIIAFIKKQQ